MSTQRRRFFFSIPTLFILSALSLSGLSGCENDEAAVKEAAAEKAKKIREEKAAEEKTRAQKVPMSPVDLFRMLPKMPPGFAVFPGASVAALKKQRPGLKESPYSPLWLSEHPESGPFQMVHYQTDKKSQTVEAILGTFVPGYNLKERKEALIEAIQIRLGAGETFAKGNYEGRRWKLIDFRLDLRTDKASGSLELLIHRRGRFDPVAQPD